MGKLNFVKLQSGSQYMLNAYARVSARMQTARTYLVRVFEERSEELILLIIVVYKSEIANCLEKGG